jgi:hypothetical protein
MKFVQKDEVCFKELILLQRIMYKLYKVPRY